MQNLSNIILVIDLGNPKCDGHIHDSDFLHEISHTLLPIHSLILECEKIGIKCITPDVILSRKIKIDNKKILLLSHLVNARTPDLIKAGCIPCILLCQESPFIATKFYLRFNSISSQFRYTIAFSGMEKFASNKTKFVKMHFPIYDIDNLKNATSFNQRKKLVLVAGNKNAPLWKTLPIKLIYGLSVKLIYPVRAKLVSELAEIKAIDIFGRGWENNSTPAIKNAYLGSLDSDAKTATISKYKFTLCFENAIFPGYTTEKIFDSFLALSVPIYLGDPNILNNVPGNTFIDARNFKNGNALNKYLKNISETEYNAYIDAIKSYIKSDKFIPFTSTAFVGKITSIIKENYGT